MLNWTKEQFEAVAGEINRLDMQRRTHNEQIKDHANDIRWLSRRVADVERDFKLLMERLDLVFEDEPARRVIRKVGS